MQSPPYDAARARDGGGGGETENGELRDEQLAAAAPQVAIERVIASGHSDSGALVSLCVETGTQGEVTLVIEAGKVPGMIDVLAAELVRAFKAAEIAGGEPPRRMMFPVQGFAVGEVSDSHGVLLTLNQGQPGERHFLIGNPQHAIALAQALIKQAAAHRSVIQNRSRLILPPGRPN